MAYEDDDKIIKEEIDGIIVDLKIAYEQSGRKASGKFGEGLEARYEPNKGSIWGFTYLAGRGATKNGHEEGTKYLWQAILDWLKVKGIRPREEKMKLSSLAFLIARKIHKDGTDSSKWLKIYEEVITPERINRIIDRVAKLNVNRIITETRAELTLLAKAV